MNSINNNKTPNRGKTNLIIYAGKTYWIEANWKYGKIVSMVKLSHAYNLQNNRIALWLSVEKTDRFQTITRSNTCDTVTIIHRNGFILNKWYAIENKELAN